MAKDPYKYFRVEARELIAGLTQGVLDFERGSSDPDLVPRLLRLAHTLKGAARVVKQPAIAELAHSIEDRLALQRDRKAPLSDKEVSELLRQMDSMATLVQALDPEKPAAAPPRAPGAVEEPLETVRVDLREMDTLLHGIGEAAVQLGVLSKGLSTLEPLRSSSRSLADELEAQRSPSGGPAAAAAPRLRALAEELASTIDRLVPRLAAEVERIEASFGEIHDVAHRLRLVPVRTIFPALERAVRDAASELKKQVGFEAGGGDVRLDAHVLLSLRDAVMHVVRNAVTHGIEAETLRRASGKPPRGLVGLAVERRGRRVAFVCTDDGAGVDLEAVKRAALERGLIQPEHAPLLTVEQAITLLSGGGLTTSARVTELSGRGIGLDVVRETAQKLNGTFRLKSEAGKGVSVELEVPVSLAALQGLLVEVGSSRAVIPLDVVRQARRVVDADVARSATGQSILYEGKVIPFLPLEFALSRTRSTPRRERVRSCLVLGEGARAVAIGVDRLLGTSSVVLRTLPDVVQASPIVAGASVDTDGNPQLILDPAGLFSVAENASDSEQEAPSVERAPILVIDDSLTTRMLEQSILESAGYVVDLAVSAEDGLAKARERRYGLFIVDVEMPGMDGFEFVATVRADALLGDTPAILVTSRSAVEDRQRGERVGAQAYIVKGEFDQEHLLRTIRRLVA